MTKEHVQRMLSKVPRGRFLEIHEFTSLVCWLSSEENSFSTAAIFDISGVDQLTNFVNYLKSLSIYYYH